MSSSKAPSRRGRPPKGQESKLAAVMAFAQTPPRNWESLSSRERKERVCRAVGVNPAYLQQLITRNEGLKDFFGIVRRRRRDRVQVRPQEVVRLANLLELNDLLHVSRQIRQELQRRIAITQAEVNAAK